MSTNTENLENLYIFDGFSKEVISYFLLMTQVQMRKKGEIIIKQGEISNGCAYYINSWSVKVSIDGEEIATISRGGFFGEMALITDDVRSATVEALEDTEVQVFLKEDFLTLIMQSWNGEAMKAEIRKRIVENTQKSMKK